ncbi:P-loop containing nucleoside triphosphate hydrolase protein, partial [Baffinella frigidus]
MMVRGMPAHHTLPNMNPGGGGGKKKGGKGKGGGGKQAKQGGGGGGNMSTTKSIRRAADAGNCDEALKGMRMLLQQGQIEEVAMGMVVSALLKAGRLHDASALLTEAKQRVGRPVLQLSIVLSILISMPMRAWKEEAAAGGFVNALCDLAVWSEGPNARVYFNRIAIGLVAEYLEEARVASERMHKQGWEMLARQGNTIVDITCSTGKKKGEIACSVPPRQNDRETRGISGGDLVCITPFAPGGLDGDTIECEVGIVLGGQVIIKSPEQREADRLMQSGTRWRMDKMANKVAYVRQLKALRTICGPGGNGSGHGQMPQMAMPGRKSKKGDQRPDKQIIEALLEPKPPGNALSARLVALCAAPCISRATFRALPVPQTGSATLRALNPSQQQAIANATLRRITLVQGPPGTGKTHTSLKILEWWVRSLAHGAGPVLATSDSNIAVDNILEGLAKMGIRVVRLGRPDKVRPELLQYCVDVPKEGQLMVDFGEKQRLLRAAQVVCATCVATGSDQLEGFRFAGVLLDEASQVTESSSIVPLCRSCDQLVLVGDQCQLPPTVASRVAMDAGAGEPLFNRLVKAGVRPLLLDTQYRMHPGISEFPADLFYGGAIKDGITAADRTAPKGFRWPNKDIPVAFIPVRHGHENNEGTSKSNTAEVDEVLKVASSLIEGGLKASEIGIVSPYSAQVRALRRGFRGAVEVNSVDGFQGREKEVIIISTVRSSQGGSLGFLADWRRVNVAFTRPRSALLVVGNPNTLYRDTDTWRPWLRWVQSKGLDYSDPTPQGTISREELRAACPSGIQPTDEDGENYSPHPGAPSGPE